jgi:TRAP-type transport system periplasmic protein
MKRTTSRRLLSAAAALTAGSLALTACGNGGGDDDGSDDVTTLRAGTIYDGSVPVVRCGFSELEEDPGLADVGLELDTVDSGQLGAEGQLLEQASSGELDIVLGIGSIVATTFGIESPALFEAYYLHEDLDDIERVQSTDIAQEIWDEVEESANLVSIGIPWLYGERHIFGNAELRNPEDFSGVDLRVPNADISRDSAAALGANVATTEYTELFLALQQGVVDAAEAPLPNINAESFDEVSDYVNLTGHLITTHGVLINGDRWESLDDEQREFLDEKVGEIAQNVVDCVEEDEQAALEEWEEAGTPEVIDDVDREALGELAYEAYSEGYEWSDQYVDMLEELGRE